MTNAATYHYRECGLDNVWLKNGFTKEETPYGETTAIHDIEGLHKVIGTTLVKNQPELCGEELRFLRKEMDFPQVQLAHILDTSESTIRNWENDRNLRGAIPKTAATLVRKLYLEYIKDDSTLRESIDRIGQLNRDIHCHGKTLELEETEQGWIEAA